MSTLFQVSLLLVTLQWINVHSNPLFEGINFHRSFGISFKPLPRKPISFIREKWSPFGVFGSRHAIQKRDLENVSTQEENFGTHIPPKSSETPQEFPKETDSLETSPSEIIPSPIQPPPESSDFIIPHPNRIGGVMPPPGLYTDIARAGPVNRYLNLLDRPSVAPVVEEEYPLPTPLPPRVSPPLSPLSLPPPIVDSQPTVNIANGTPLGDSQITTSIRSYLTNAFLQILSQFFNNARMTLSRFVNQP